MPDVDSKRRPPPSHGAAHGRSPWPRDDGYMAGSRGSAGARASPPYIVPRPRAHAKGRPSAAWHHPPPSLSLPVRPSAWRRAGHGMGPAIGSSHGRTLDTGRGSWYVPRAATSFRIGRVGIRPMHGRGLDAGGGLCYGPHVPFFPLLERSPSRRSPHGPPSHGCPYGAWPWPLGRRDVGTSANLPRTFHEPFTAFLYAYLGFFISFHKTFHEPFTNLSRIVREAPAPMPDGCPRPPSCVPRLAGQKKGIRRGRMAGAVQPLPYALRMAGPRDRVTGLPYVL